MKALPGNGPNKLTRGCRIVLQALSDSSELSSAQDIYGRLRRGRTSALGLTTVYRSLEALAAMGLAQSVMLGDGERYYELNHPGAHHHHLICQKCGSSTHLDRCMVETIEKTVKHQYGFETRSHVLELFGFCKSCLRRAK